MHCVFSEDLLEEGGATGTHTSFGTPIEYPDGEPAPRTCLQMLEWFEMIISRFRRILWVCAKCSETQTPPREIINIIMQHISETATTIKT